MENRHINYNKSLDLVKNLEDAGDAFIIRPKSPVKISQIEKNRERLNQLYEDGYNDAKEVYNDILKFMKKE